MSISRRKFIKDVGTTAMIAPFINPFYVFGVDDVSGPLDVHLFSKHLQFLNYKEASEAAAEIGFDGLDLTVRPKGHVLPENVKRDLPKAISAIKNAGLSCEMITTAVGDIANPLDVDVLQTASAEGVKFYRSNWFKYKNDLSLKESLEFYKEKVRQLSNLNERLNIVGCYQNHSGMKVGASMWEVDKILESANPKYFGAQYDIRHAVAEGGRSWPNGIQLIKGKIKNIVLKDFRWGQVDGHWKIINVPVGEGMVNFDAYFKILKEYKMKPMVSLHLEYPLGGAEKGRSEIKVDKKVVFDAMKKDLTTIQKLWREA